MRRTERTEIVKKREGKREKEKERRGERQIERQIERGLGRQRGTPSFLRRPGILDQPHKSFIQHRPLPSTRLFSNILIYAAFAANLASFILYLRV